MLDADLAGCAVCGVLHACSDGGACPVSKSESGHDTCTITGCVVKSVSYCNTEYVDTALEPAFNSAHTHWSALDGVDMLRSQVHAYCLEMLVGDKWEQSIANEQEKTDAKRKGALLRALRTHKIENPGVMPNLATIACVVLHEMRGGRSVASTPVEARRALADWCADCITRHLQILYAVCPDAVPVQRLRSITVGLLYLMRSGIEFQGVVVLPRCKELQAVLPMETYLEPNYSIRTKVITEVENLVKFTLKSCSGETLVRCGAESVDRRVGSMLKA